MDDYKNIEIIENTKDISKSEIRVTLNKLYEIILNKRGYSGNDQVLTLDTALNQMLAYSYIGVNNEPTDDMYVLKDENDKIIAHVIDM